MWQFANLAAKSPGCSAVVCPTPNASAEVELFSQSTDPGLQLYGDGQLVDDAAPFEECVELMVSTMVSPTFLCLFGKVMKEVCLATSSLGFLEPTCLTLIILRTKSSLYTALDVH